MVDYQPQWAGRAYTSGMNRMLRSLCAATGAVLTLVTVPSAVLVVAPTGVANADVCASVGRRVSVGGCADLGDVMAPYVPPPGYYAPMPEDYVAPPPPPPPPAISGCVGFNGRRGRVSVSGCN
jgi:hypothetical protein